MANSIYVDGVEHPVTPAWHDAVLAAHPDLAIKTHDQLEAERGRLLALSDARGAFRMAAPAGAAMAPNGTLTADEQARLDAVTHVVNVHRAVRFLAGRSHRDFGFDGVDQVHGNMQTLGCGCVLRMVFDHHRRFEADLEIHPHAPARRCEAHSHIADDARHFEVARADAASAADAEK